MNLCLYLHLDLIYSSLNFVLTFVSNCWFLRVFLAIFTRATCQLLLAGTVSRANINTFFSKSVPQNIFGFLKTLRFISTPFGLLSSFWITFLLSKPFGLGDTAYIPPFEDFYGSLTINYSRQRWETFCDLQPSVESHPLSFFPKSSLYSENPTILYWQRQKQG